jgi:hypothetical protein
MRITVEVLECKSGVSKKGNAYNIALVRGADGNVGKVFSDVALKPSADPIEVNLDLSSNQEMFLTPRIRSVVE